MHKYIYLLIKQRIIAKIVSIKEVDWYKGQDDPNVKGSKKILPGAYIRFRPVDLKSLGGGIQEGIVEFDIILLTDNLSDDDSKIDNQQATITPASVWDDSWDDSFTGNDAPPDPSIITWPNHLDLVDLIHLHVSGYRGQVSDITAYLSLIGTPFDLTVINTIERTRVETDQDNRSIMKTTLSFKGYAKDYSGNKSFAKAVKSLEIVQL
jgi:hypothetical protein